MVKVFLAHPKASGDTEIAAASAKLQAALVADSPELDFSITPGRDDYNAHVAKAGSWSTWAASVPTRYDVVILDRRDVGKATMQILKACFELMRPVMLLEEGQLVQIGSVQTLDARNFQAGWRAVGGREVSSR